MDALTQKARELAAAHFHAGQLEDERDRLIRAEHQNKAPISAIIQATGLSRARIYQILDLRQTGDSGETARLLCPECDWASGSHPEEADPREQLFTHRAEAGHWGD